MTTWVSILGDAADPTTHSGTQYYFHRSLYDLDPEARAMNLSTDGLAVRRLGWAASRSLRLRRPGGFQYSRGFLEAIWRGHVGTLGGTRVVNFFQLYPPSVVARGDIERWFYLDLTLRQLFDFYGLGRRLSRRDRTEVLARERAGYHAAAGIIAMSEFAAESLRGDYGLPGGRVRVVPPGANIDPDQFAEADRGGAPAEPPGVDVRVGFVGKDWSRKGLDRLIGGLSVARSLGHQFTLTVVGCNSEDVPGELRRPWIDWAGSVDKRYQAHKFVSLLSGCDIGCLLSRSDASPIALREFHALGRPTVATDVGGCREMVPPDASVLLAADASEQNVAETFSDLVADRSKLLKLQRVAWARRAEARWETAVRALTPLLARHGAGG